MAGSTSAITLSNAADSMPNDETSGEALPADRLQGCRDHFRGRCVAQRMIKLQRRRQCARLQFRQDLIRERIHWPALSE